MIGGALAEALVRITMHLSRGVRRVVGRAAQALRHAGRSVAVPVFIGALAVVLLVRLLAALGMDDRLVGGHGARTSPILVGVVLVAAAVALVAVVSRGGATGALTRLVDGPGLRVADRVGLAICFVGALILVPPSDRAALVVVMAAALAFAVASCRDSAVRPVGRGRPLINPVGVPEGTLRPSAAAAEQSPHSFPYRVERPTRPPLEGSIEVIVDLERYQRMRETNPWRTEGSQDWSHFITTGTSDEVIQVARQCLDLAATEELSPYLEASIPLAMMQAIPYADDETAIGTPEYYRYAIETFEDEKGDCDCKTIATLSVLRAMGHKVVLVQVAPKNGVGHVAAGVAGAEGLPGNFLRRGDQIYLWGETTATGWRLGEIPDETNLADVRLIPID